MQTKYTIEKDHLLTSEELEALNNIKKSNNEFDAENPPLTEKELIEMGKLAKMQRESRRKEIISIRLDHETLGIFKSMGKGYTSIISQIVYKVARDPEYLKKCLEN